MNKQSGFTLVELMIAVAVVTILALVAIPSYTSFVQKSARGDAMAVLMDMRLKQERYRQNNSSYAVTLASVSIGTSSPNGKYNVAIVNAGAGTFLATATPAGTQASDSCGTFAVDQNGPNTTGGYANNACWKR